MSGERKTRMLNRLNLTQRFVASFSMLTLVLTGIAILAGCKFNAVSGLFVMLESTTDETSVTGAVGMALAEAQLSGHRYLVSPGGARAAEARDRLDTALEGAGAALHVHPEWKALQDRITTDTRQSNDAPDRSVVLGEDWDRPIGISVATDQEARMTVSQVLDATHRDGAGPGPREVALSLQELMLARLYAGRFLITGDSTHYERANVHLSAATDWMGKAKAANADGSNAASLDDVSHVVLDFRVNSTPTRDAVVEMESLRTAELGMLGSKIVSTTTDMLLTIGAEQQSMGSAVAGDLASATKLMQGVAAFAIVAGVFIAVLIARTPFCPNRFMVGPLDVLADGDVSREPSTLALSDAVGQAQRALVRMTPGSNNLQRRMPTGKPYVGSNAIWVVKTSRTMILRPTRGEAC